MMDLTTDIDERAYYKIRADISKDFKNIIVTYADDHQETIPFTIHNYTAEVYLMKEQFYRKEKAYTELMDEYGINTWKREIISIVVSLIGVIFTVNTSLPLVWKIVICVAAILAELGYSLRNLLEFAAIGFEIEGMENTKKFLEFMDKFKISVTDPINGRVEDWYLRTLNDVGASSDLGMLEAIADGLGEEEKKEESKKLTLTIRKAYEKK